MSRANPRTAISFFLFLATLIIVFAIIIIKALDKPFLENYAIAHDNDFGGVFIKSTIDDFNDMGFRYGDSVDVTFSNGYELKSIPYYNGYYVDIDEPLLIGYSGYEYIKVGINYGDDLWVTANLTEDDTATIKLAKHNLFSKTQMARDIHYSDTQGDTPDAVFANFRNVAVGNIKDGILYRSASPVDNTHNRAPIVDKLIKEAGVYYIIDLSDDSEGLIDRTSKSDFNSPHFLSLYNAGRVLPLAMTIQFKEQTFKEKLVRGLTAISGHTGPYLVHCVEGKDRTGYVIMTIEALLGASYDEIIDDYMITYDNYYGINKDSDKERYGAIKEKNIDLMLSHLTGDEDETTDLSQITNYSDYARSYLLSIGMDEDSINRLINNLSE